MRKKDLPPILYPREKFTAEVRRRKAENIAGGWHDPSNKLELKCIFPAFTPIEDRSLKMRMQTALVLQNTGIQNDLLSSITPQITLRGFGAPDKGMKPTGEGLLPNTVEVLVDSMGFAGSAHGLFLKLRQKLFHIFAAEEHHINLRIRKQALGSIAMNTYVVEDPQYLARCGFPSHEHDLPEDSSGILYTDIQAKFSQDQVQAIVENARHGNRRYDYLPRLVWRLHYPESGFNSLGVHPGAAFHTSFHSSAGADKTFHEMQPVELDPVRYLDRE